MKPCIRCHRHVRRTESGCPFCGTPLHDAPAPTALATFTLGAALLACGPGQPQGPAESTDTSTTVPDSATVSSTTDVPTTDAPTTSTSTSTTDCADDCSTGYESAAFIYGNPDPGPRLDCDPFAQDCPPDQKCAAVPDGRDSWGNAQCVPITGDQAPGEPCASADAPGDPPTGADDCRLGAMCWNLDETNHGTCAALCTGDPDTPVCPTDFACLRNGNGALNLCVPTCDPLLPVCADDASCVAFGVDFLCIADASGDEGQTNDPCEFINNCDPGLLCLNTASASAACQQGSQGCCQPLCTFPDGPCPNPDQQCIQWFPPDDIPPGHEDVGICAIPQ